MPSPDTRLWNLIPAALLLASACQTDSTIPIDDTETGSSSGDGDGDPAGDGDGDGDDDPTAAGDPTGDGDGDGDGDDECPQPCGPGQICLGGHCYTIPNDPECNNDLHCDPGEFCELYDVLAGDCAPLAELPVCEPPELVEIPLPDGAQGSILDLQFVDVDGDGSDELLLLKPGELLVVEADQSVTTAAVDPLSEEFVILHADADEHLDVILTSGTPDHGGRLLGNGNGSFASATGLMIPALQQPHALDWPSGGGQDLLALELDTFDALLFSNLGVDAPAWITFPVDSFVSDNLHAVHVADFGLDNSDEVVLRRNCQLSIQGARGEVDQMDVQWTGCRSQLARFGDSTDPYILVLAESPSHTHLLWFSGSGEQQAGTLVPGTISDLAGAEELGLVIVGPDGTRLLRPDDPFACVAPLDALPAATRVIAGDFTDNPGDEFLLLGQTTTLWARP